MSDWWDFRTEDVVCSDCLDHMRTMPDGLIDAVITDPPYGLSFMGKDWDTFGCDTRQPGDENYVVADNAAGRSKIRYGYGSKYADAMRRFQDAMTPVFAEALRVSKPGAHLLCFGGTRTYHRMTCAIEDAGWEIRDCIMWVYGSGFPKSMDVGKAIDKALGAKREKVPATGGLTNNRNLNDDNWSKIGSSNPTMDGPLPITEEATQWDGWGTCLKPAWEPVIVARKPLDGTVAHNVVTHGTGAINIDGCRVSTEDSLSTHSASKLSQDSQLVYGTYGKKETHQTKGQKLGRFPANLVHDGSDEILELFPNTGKSSGGGMHTRGNAGSERTNVYGSYSGGVATKSVGLGDSGSAARFFYCAKANKKDRGGGNDHPTVKPTSLMEWLVKLVTREDSLVLDPFCGSGSTLVACKRLGREFIGIDANQHYCDITTRRLDVEGGDA